MEIELSKKEFELFRNYIYNSVGISLSEQKSALIKGRLNKRVKELSLNSFTEYYEFLVQSKEELGYFVSAISTNVTSFFRESAQWVWLEGYLPKMVAKKQQRKIRIWSAGCSSGEEPYTILMFLAKHLKDFDAWDIKILATDISQKVLEKAISGRYEAKEVASLPKETITSFFAKTADGGYEVVPKMRQKVLFRLYNLVTDPFIFKNKFDMIFCRNVMIYFDDVTRTEVVEKFVSLLDKGSPLLLGSSESLTANKDKLALMGSSIYAKQ